MSSLCTCFLASGSCVVTDTMKGEVKCQETLFPRTSPPQQDLSCPSIQHVATLQLSLPHLYDAQHAFAQPCLASSKLHSRCLSNENQEREVAAIYITSSHHQLRSCTSFLSLLQQRAECRPRYPARSPILTSKEAASPGDFHRGHYTKTQIPSTPLPWPTPPAQQPLQHRNRPHRSSACTLIIRARTSNAFGLTSRSSSVFRRFWRNASTTSTATSQSCTRSLAKSGVFPMPSLLIPPTCTLPTRTVFNMSSRQHSSWRTASRSSKQRTLEKTRRRASLGRDTRGWKVLAGECWSGLDVLRMFFDVLVKF